MADYLSQFTGSEIDSRLAKVPQLESGKQDTLVSGTNIKTVNGNSILGSGNLQIQTGETDVVKYTAQTLTEEQKAQARANIDAASLEDINSMDFVTAASLPTASASTMGHIYLIGPDASNNYDRYFTQQDGSSYSWVSLGSTQIDLSTYATQAEVDQLDLKQYVPVKEEVYEILNYSMNSGTGKFGSDTTYKHLCLAVQEGDHYAIGAPSSQNCSYAFVTSKDATAGGDIPLVTGYSVTVVTANTKTQVTIPTGCSYLLIYNFANARPFDISLFVIEKVQDIDERLKVVGFIYKTSATKFSDYNPSILELYFTPKSLEGVANIDFRNYAGYLYAVAKDANNSTLWVVDSFALGGVQNGIVTPLAATSAGGSISVGDTVGYVVFSDIVTFSATYVANSNSSPLNLDFVARHTNSPRICSYIENNTNLKWRKYSSDPTISDTYEKCVAELYINKQICQKSGVTGVACSCYGTDFYVFGRDDSSIVWSMKRSLSTFKNGEVCPLFITTAGGGLNVYDTIGYIVFSDVSTFGTKPSPSGFIYLNSNTVMKIENFPLIQSSSFYAKGFFPLAEKSPIYRINESVSAYAIYEGCVKEFWVNPKFMKDLSEISVKNWGGTLYVDARKTATVWSAVFSLANYSDGDVVPITVTAPGGEAHLNEIVGYIIFSDIATFKTTNYGGYVYTDVDRAARLDLNKSIWYAVTAFQNEMERSINEKMVGDLDMILPTTIYAAVGVQLNIYNDAIALSMDKGLNSPTNYIVRWACGKGTITNRCFRYTPVVGDIGDVSLTCYVYTISGELYATKTCTIKVVAASIASAKRVVFFGDSTGAGSASALYADFNDAGLFSGTKPTMLGVRGTTPKYEAFGGARWADYATEGRAAYRCQVSGVGAIALNSQYTNNGFTWRVVEVNVTEGVGNILITKDDLYSSVDAPQTNGTLTPVGGGDNIAYTGATKEAGNPLWHNNAIDFAHYRNTLGLGANDKLDLVSFQLGLNGSEDNATLRQYIIDLYTAAVADNADCIFLIGLVTGPCNTVDAYGVNYGAGDWKATIRRYHAKRKVYEELVASGDYPNMRIATPNLNIDRYYGFPLGTRAVSARNNTQEEYHTNFVHPSESGYAQIADAFFSAYIATLNE